MKISKAFICRHYRVFTHIFEPCWSHQNSNPVNSGFFLYLWAFRAILKVYIFIIYVQNLAILNPRKPMKNPRKTHGKPMGLRKYVRNILPHFGFCLIHIHSMHIDCFHHIVCLPSTHFLNLFVGIPFVVHKAGKEVAQFV